jgi:NitT/TauT family transport system substrate-binding protein
MIDVRVTSSAVHTNYAPCYLADTLGFFGRNGLRVDASIPAGPGSSWLASNLIDDKADFAMGGIWIPLAYRGRLADLPIAALVCHRNPQAIMSREPVAGFDWTSLYGRKMVLSMSATSQWMFLEGCMKNAGADPTRVAFLRDLDVATTMRLWRGGLGDFFLVDPLTAEELEQEGYHIASTMAQICGPVPWSVYYTSPRVLQRGDGMAGLFVRSIQQTLDWIHGHSDAEVAEGIAPYFPGKRLDLVARSIGRLRACGVWRADTTIPREPFDAYQRIIADFGLIERPFPFTDVVVYPKAA